MNRIGSSIKLGGCMSGHVAKLIILIAFVVTLLLAGSPAQALEGAGHYVGGNEDFMAGALPPPGMYPISYFVNYHATKIRNNNGDDIAPPDFKLNVYAYALRFVHVTKAKLLGADWAWQVIVPLVNQTVDVPGKTFKSTGLGDIEFSPLVLGWHFSKNMHLIGALDFMAPTGSFDSTDPSSIGQNYWTIAPIVAPTYISDGGFEVSGKFQYFFNTKNNDTKYTSGNEFLLDYLVGQHVGDWNFGINGFIHKQLTDDEVNGVTKKDNLAQSVSVGPAVQYNYKNMFFNAKYQWDTSVKNGPEGQKLWLKFLYAF